MILEVDATNQSRGSGIESIWAGPINIIIELGKHISRKQSSTRKKLECQTRPSV